MAEILAFLKQISPVTPSYQPTDSDTTACGKTFGEQTFCLDYFAKRKGRMTEQFAVRREAKGLTTCL